MGGLRQISVPGVVARVKEGGSGEGRGDGEVDALWGLSVWEVIFYIGRFGD